MHRLTRWIDHAASDIRIRHRRDEIMGELQAFLRRDDLALSPVKTAFGVDSIYNVSGGMKKIGVLRLDNPYKIRPSLPPDLPFTLGNTGARLEREWTAYEQGARTGLTPKPLWRTHDALLRAWSPFHPLSVMLDKMPERAWKILTHCINHIDSMHQSGMTHMRLMTNNILADDGLNQMIFTDFSCAPTAHVPPPAQRLFDYLHLVDSAWKKIPAKNRADGKIWFEAFSARLDGDMRAVNLSVLAPGLKTIMAAPEFMAQLKAVLK